MAEHGLKFGMKVTQGDDGQLFFVDEEAGAGAETTDE